MTETLPFDGTNVDRAIGVEASGGMTYSGASAEGRIPVEIPALPGSPNQIETLHVATFGPHVSSRVESALNKQGYLRSGPQQKPAEVFRHYLACAKGAGLLDAGALKNAETLAKEFSSEANANQREYFQQVLRPWLLSLSSEKR